MKKIIKRLCLLLLLLTAILTAHADPVASINENFDASSSIPAGWTQKQVAGDKAWYVPSFNGNNYAAMTGFKGTAPFDQWLLSPAIDMDKVSDKTLTFDTQVNGYGATTTTLKVYIVTDPANLATATELKATFATAPAAGADGKTKYSEWVKSGNVDLAKYKGKVYIAFRYQASKDANYATWCVDNVKLNAEGGVTPPTTSGDGSENNPYNPAEVIAFNPQSSQEAVKSGVWVTGYIVGWADVSAAPYAINAETAHFDASATMATNILVASSADVKDVSKCIGVQLPTGEIRSALNLQANPGNLGKSLQIKGDIMKYCGVPGIKNATAYKLEGGSTPTPTPTDPVASINENFDASSSIPAGWTQKQVAGDKAWYVPSFNGNNYAAMTGFKGNGPFDQWLISPPIIIDQLLDKTLTFDAQVNAYGSTQSALKVFVLTAADPTPDNATQLSPNLAIAPASGYSDWVNSGKLDLSAFSGIIYIGFEYTSPVADNYATWCVDNVKLNVGGALTPDFVYNNIQFEVFENSDSCYVIGGGSPELVIPATAINPKNNKTYKVTAIGSAAFKGTSLNSITIPEGVTSIWNDAFNECQSLTSVKMPKTLKYIGVRAFYNCSKLNNISLRNTKSCGNEAFSGCESLTVIDLEGMASIGNSAFYGCASLTDINMKNITSLGYSAFRGCTGLTSLTIPNSVTSIGEGAFWDCSGLTSVTFNAEKCTHMGSGYNPVFNGCRNLTTLTIGDKVMVIPNYAFCDCSGLTSVTIPNSVTSIGNEAFWDCSGLTSLTIGNSVASIDNSAFFDCSKLTSLTIPNSVTSIGNSAFGGCSGLTSLTIGNSVTSIGGYAFSGCSGLTSVTIPNSVTSIGGYAFSGCSGLTSVVFNAENCTKMGYYFFPVFAECSKLSTLTTGEKVTTIPAYAFMGCTALAKADMNSVSNFGEEAFSGCTGLKSVSMLKAKSVDASVFKGCNAIETLVLPYEWGADFKMELSGTTQLRTLYIGENTASIPNKTFVNNKYLFEVYSNAATPPSIGTATFSSETYSYATLYVPQGCVDAYKAANGWSKFEDIQELPFQIVVKDKKASVDRTKSILVSASVTPASATSSDVKWYSLDDEIATVTTDGVVTGMAEGGVTILAYCDGITAPMKVIVKKFDGVEDVMADDPTELSEFDVYNLQGIRVRTNCTKEQLSELSHGIYILVSPQGRKKVII